MLCVVGVVQNIYTAHISRWLSRHACDSLLFVFFFFFFVWRFLSLLLLFLFRYIYTTVFSSFFFILYIMWAECVSPSAYTTGTRARVKKGKKKKMGFLYPVFPSACDIVSFFFFFFSSLLFSFLSPHYFLILCLVASLFLSFFFFFHLLRQRTSSDGRACSLLYKTHTSLKELLTCC